MNNRIVSIAVLIIAVAIGYYFIFALPKINEGKQQQNYYAQEALCATEAGNFFDRELKNSEYFSKSYKSHYSKGLNQCFVLIEQSNGNPFAIYKAVSDIFTQKQIALFIEEDELVNCTVNEKWCASEEEFMNLIKRYMED